MALSDHEGNTHSHMRHDSSDGAPAVDRGTWVGPRGGQHTTAAEEWANRNGLPLDPPESTLPQRCSGNRPDIVHVFLAMWFETQFGPMPAVAAKLLVRELLAELDKHHWEIHYK